MKKERTINPQKKTLIQRLFPKNKSFDELEAPIQNLLNQKVFLGFLTVIGMVAILFIKIDWHFKILGEGLLFVFGLTLVHVWWLFITDSVCSLEATYLGKSEIDENPNAFIKVSSKLRHRVVSRKVYLLKDNVKYEVCVKAYDDSISKGDMVKIYTTPENVTEKPNGVVRVDSVLSLFVTKGKPLDENDSSV
ncbi:MAG: hypothetical protein IK121_03475 [Lachnospiraceae bacterium]|nr:hypothetical protein [Lachnospiraceae bacterium]